MLKIFAIETISMGSVTNPEDTVTPLVTVDVTICEFGFSRSLLYGYWAFTIKIK